MTTPTPSTDAGRSRSSSSSAGATGPNAHQRTADEPQKPQVPQVPQAEQAPPAELHNRPLQACAPLDARLPLPVNSSASVQSPSGGQTPVAVESSQPNALGQIVDPFPASGAVASAARFMRRFEKIETAREILKTVSAMVQQPRNTDLILMRQISVISELVADEDCQEALAVRKQLKLECSTFLKWSNFSCHKALLRAELIRLDPANALIQLHRLLGGLDGAYLSSDELDLIAIATVQADPEGRAYIPGTEDVNTGPLSDGYIEGGRTFSYPPVLAARRAKVQAFMQASAGVLNQHEIQGALQHEITPRDWPTLRAHLRENP
jgi:hypothetical protein